jgi:hypothetical protein
MLWRIILIIKNLFNSLKFQFKHTINFLMSDSEEDTTIIPKIYFQLQKWLNIISRTSKNPKGEHFFKVLSELEEPKEYICEDYDYNEIQGKYNIDNICSRNLIKSNSEDQKFNCICGVRLPINLIITNYKNNTYILGICCIKKLEEMILHKQDLSYHELTIKIRNWIKEFECKKKETQKKKRKKTNNKCAICESENIKSNYSYTDPARFNICKNCFIKTSKGKFAKCKGCGGVNKNIPSGAKNCAEKGCLKCKKFILNKRTSHCCGSYIYKYKCLRCYI